MFGDEPLKAQVICTAIKCSKGEFKEESTGRDIKFDSTTFYLNVSLGRGENVIGQVSAPFKYGTSEEFEKWKHLGKSWPKAGLPVEIEYVMEMTSGGRPSMALLSIRPASEVPAQAKK